MKRIWPPPQFFTQRSYISSPELPNCLGMICLMTKVSEVPRTDLLGMLSCDIWEKIIEDDNESWLTYLTPMHIDDTYIILGLRATSRVPPREAICDALFCLCMGNISLLWSNLERAGCWPREVYNFVFLIFFHDSRFKVENPFLVRPPFMDDFIRCSCSLEKNSIGPGRHHREGLS